MKKVLSLFIVLFSFIFCCSVNAQTDLIPLQESPNYKGISIIPEKTKNQSLLIDLGLLYSNSNNSNLSFTISSNDIYIIVCKTYLKSQNGVSDMLTLYNDRTINYLIENNDYYINNENLTINNNYQRFFALHCENMENKRVNIDNNINMFCYDSNSPYNEKYYIHCFIYFPKVNNSDVLQFENNMVNNSLSKVIINYIWLYQYSGIYSYYNCNSYAMPNSIVSNNYGYNVEYKSSYILQGSGNLFDLKPVVSQFNDNYIYSMYQQNYLYGFFSNANKSFSNNLNGYFDLYAFGNNGQYSLNIFNDNNIYNYDDTNGAISSDYFDINFNYFAYCYTCVLNNYYGANVINLNNFQINNNDTIFSSYYKDNTSYYSQDVGETNNTDLATDLGINKINCDWWNLKGQLNNLIYYIITGVPFINKLYSFNSTILGPLSLGFTTFLSFSPILLSIIGLVCAVKIFFKMLD